MDEMNLIIHYVRFSTRFDGINIVEISDSNCKIEPKNSFGINKEQSIVLDTMGGTMTYPSPPLFMRYRPAIANGYK